MCFLMKLVKTRLRATMHHEKLEDTMYTALEHPFNDDTGMDKAISRSRWMHLGITPASVENVDGRTSAARCCLFETYKK